MFDTSVHQRTCHKNACLSTYGVPMAKRHLTDLTIRSLKTELPQLDVWDSSLPCFGCRVIRFGTKTFILKLKNKRHSLGRWPYVRYGDAKAEARRRIGLQYIAPTAIPAEHLIDLYLQARKPNLRASSFYRVSHHLNDHFPKKSIASITAHDLYGAIAPLTPSQQNLAFAASSRRSSTGASSREYLSRNPISNTNAP